MKINQEKINTRLEGVPEQSRSFIYDASIILEFLKATFMPTRHFLPDDYVAVPGMPIAEMSFSEAAKQKSILMRDLYETYRLFREEKDYTRAIESRYVFTLIIKHLRYYKNGWEFKVFRVSRAQVWHVGPIQLRIVGIDPVTLGKDKTVVTALESTVEADPIEDPVEERFVEITDEVSRFKEAVEKQWVEVDLPSVQDW